LPVKLYGKENEHKPQQKKCNIYVGGTILGRGLAFANLITTILIKESSICAIDTLMQRAR
jgi:late competence protein required for DNA uptake (superfamily II DNA/RNA helicase)